MAFYPPQQQQQVQQQQDVVSGEQYRYALTNFVCFLKIIFLRCMCSQFGLTKGMFCTL